MVVAHVNLTADGDAMTQVHGVLDYDFISPLPALIRGTLDDHELTRRETPPPFLRRKLRISITVPDCPSREREAKLNRKLP